MLIRASILLLLVLNLGVALWWALREPPPGPLPVASAPGVERLRLVSEGEGADRGRAARPAPVSQCLRLGPFADAATAAAVRTRLAPLTIEIRPHRDYAGTARSWKVLLPSTGSIEDAEATAERIGEAGFSDRFVIRDGEDAGAVALGLYRGETAARERAQTLRAAGFAAEPLPVGAGPARYWLDVAAAEGFDPDAAVALADGTGREPLDCAAFGAGDAAPTTAEPAVGGAAAALE